MALNSLPDFSYKGDVPTAAIIQAYQQKAQQEQQQRIEQEQLKQQKIQNVTNVFRTGADIVSTLVQENKQKQLEDAQKAVGTLFSRGSEPVPSDTIVSAQSSLFPGMTQAPTTQPFSGTPTYRDQLASLLTKAYPQEAGKNLTQQFFQQAFPGQKTSSLQTKTVNVNGKPTEALFNPQDGSFYDAATKTKISDPITPFTPHMPPSEIANVRREALIQNTSQKMGQDLNELSINSNSPAGISAKRALYAKSGLTLIKQAESQPGSTDKRQMAELQMEVARVLTGQGIITNEQLNNLATHTAKTKVKNWEEWWSNKPTGQGQQEFVQRFKETLQRQLAFHSSELDRNREKTMAKYANFRTKFPDEFNSVLEQGGYDTEAFKKSKKLVPLSNEIPSEFQPLIPSEGLPQIGQMYNGGKVLSIKRIQ